MKRWLISLLLTLPVQGAFADEGMWTFNNFPADQVHKTYGFRPDAAWLDHVRLSSVRLAQGCSGSFVSGTGLVMTNHHCAHRCIEQLSTAHVNFVEKGFYAPSFDREKKCPNLEVNQLVGIEDVTARVRAATAQKSGKAYEEAKKAVLSQIEKACATSELLRCEVVSLYSGGKYDLYRYQRHQDVRLVFAPEAGIAFFGGDPDNFNFPRYDLDVAFLRVYDGGKALKSEHHLTWSASGAKENELVFVSGHPGGTSRLDTVAELIHTRDFGLPRYLLGLAELRGLLTQFSAQAPEAARTARGLLFGVENALKALKGRHAALADAALMAQKMAAEREFRARLEQSPELKGHAAAFAEIDRALVDQETIALDYGAKEGAARYGSRLFTLARTLLRHGDEQQKPNEQRLREYVESALPAVRADVLSPAPIYAPLEILLLTQQLTKLREDLGADDPYVKLALGNAAPAERAAALVKGTKLFDLKVRTKLFEGGRAAVSSSKDPLIEFVRVLDPGARAVRTRYDDEIKSRFERAHEQLADARFKLFGTSQYPDATFTLRLSFGQVKGFPHRGETVPPFTTIGGAFERATGRPPFALPERWLREKNNLALETPFNLVTTNDIIGGNSGSPLFNQRAEVVGLIFDGNIYSLGGEYGFDGSKNRAVAVHSAGLLETLQKIYRAERIVKEIKAPGGAS